MKITRYEGGIPWTEEVPDLTPAQMRQVDWLMENAPCTCRGEAHDECRPCDECGETPALNEVQDDPDGGTMSLCDECYEAAVIAEEAAFQEARAEDEMQSLDWIREDHLAMQADAILQREKEEWV